MNNLTIINISVSLCLKRLNIYRTRKITIVIAFLSAVSAIGLASIGSIASASIDYNDSASEEEPFKVLVTIGGVKGHCGEEVKITVAVKSETYDLCGD